MDPQLKDSHIGTYAGRYRSFLRDFLNLTPQDIGNILDLTGFC